MTFNFKKKDLLLLGGKFTIFEEQNSVQMPFGTSLEKLGALQIRGLIIDEGIGRKSKIEPFVVIESTRE